MVENQKLEQRLLYLRAILLLITLLLKLLHLIVKLVPSFGTNLNYTQLNVNPTTTMSQSVVHQQKASNINEMMDQFSSLTSVDINNYKLQ